MTAVSASVPSEIQAEAPASPSLKNLAIQGSVWTIVGFGSAMVLRLGSSLVLTRLLFPAAFGMMALVGVFMQGLQMFSDIGIGPSIVQSKRGDERVYLNTAWTMQAGRGILLTLISLALAIPLSRIYGQPELAKFIAVAGLSALIAGLQSTSLFTARRHIIVGRLTVIQLLTQVITILGTIVLAWVYRSVWSLVIGGLIGTLATTLLSYVMLPGPHPRLAWDRASRAELFNFGKWIFPGSILSFVARQTDRLLMGKWVELAVLGIYSTAVNLLDPIKSLADQLVRGVLFPAYGRVARNEIHRLTEVFYRSRRWVDLLFLPGTGFLIAAGPHVVSVLYDKRYHAAGWMLQVLALGTAAACISCSQESVLVAVGKPVYAFAQNLARTLWVVVALPVGWYTGGLAGIVWAVGLSELPVVVVLWWAMWRQRLLRFRGELWSMLMFGAGIMLGIGIHFALKTFHGN